MTPPSGRVEVLPAAPARSSGQLGSRRLRVFLLVLALCLVVGLSWDFLRPPLYRASANLLTVAPPGLDEPAGEADLQHVAIQRQRLLGQPVLEAVARKLSEKDPALGELSADQLRVWIRVLPVPGTNLVELRAEGTEPLFLSALVNTWIETYLEERAREVARLDAETVQVLRDRHQAMGRKIEEKRRELREFRERHSILSTARDENEVLSRLKGLQESLNAAIDERTRAQARLEAIKAAIARGDTLVPEEDKRSYAEMVKRAQELREQVAELERRYTQAYIQRSASLRVIPEKLEKLERKIRDYQRRGQAYLLDNARQELVAAQKTAASLQQQLREMQQQASEFSARFAEYEAMQEDLASMEAQQRELQERLVKVETSNRKKYPQVQVVEWAHPPAQPVEPKYWRDAGVILIVSLVVALLAVWLVDFLRPLAPEPGPPMEVALYPSREALAREQGERISSLEPPRRQLPDTPPSVLPENEIRLLLAQEDPLIRQLAALLLTGLSAAEILALEPRDLDPESGVVRVPSEPPRELKLAPGVRAWFIREGRPWLAWQGLDAFDREELEARLQLGAREAGLADVERVSAESLRNHYLRYLLEQGLQASELEGVAGRVPARYLLQLAAHAPPGSRRTLAEVSLTHPLLEGPQVT